jgi:hypothetical protein
MADGDLLTRGLTLIGLGPKAGGEPTRTFWHADGRLWWRGSGRPVELQLRTAREMRAAYEREAGAHYTDAEIQLARRAARLWRELTDAPDALGAPNPPEAA